MKMSRTIATALVNCDPSGLSDDDLKIYKGIDFYFVVTDWEEESTDINGKCDFTGLWDHCVEIEIETN